jgi:hypothetical protein
MRNIRLVTVLTLVGGGLLLGPEAASAQGTCIQDVWKAHGNSQNVTCTSKDVTLAEATNIQISTGGSCNAQTGDCSCFAGQPLTFSADFRMDLTADTRYDAGFYIATDSDPNHDGAITGQCSATASLAGNTQGGTFINLDAAPDVCGDITGPLGTAHNPLRVRATISTTCPTVAGQQLQLPFATTWRQPGSNQVCLGTGNGTTTNDVFPGSPSKCNTGTLVLDITSVDTSITVNKTANTPNVPENTGGSANFTVEVTNSSAIAVTLTSLQDAPYGDITQVQNALTATTCVPDGVASTCEVGGVLAAGATCSCNFTATVPPGDFSGPAYADTVTACAINSTNLTPRCASDGAEVPYTNVSTPPTLAKTAAATSCVIEQTYDVAVNNASAFDSLTLNTLNDNVYGNITQVHGAVISTTCGQASGAGTLPFVITPTGNYSCSFVARTTSCNDTVHDTVTGGTVDSDGVTFTPSNDATVVITYTKS